MKILINPKAYYTDSMLVALLLSEKDTNIYQYIRISFLIHLQYIISISIPISISIALNSGSKLVS